MNQPTRGRPTPPTVYFTRMSDHCHPAAPLTGRGVVVSCTGEAPAARPSPPPTDVELLANVVNRPDPADSAPLQGLLQGTKTLGKMLQRAQCAPTTPSKCCAWVARTAPARPTRGTSKTTWTHSNNACQVRTCDPEPSAVTPLRVRACTHTRSWTPQKHLGGWEGSLDKRRLFCQAELQIGEGIFRIPGSLNLDCRSMHRGASWRQERPFSPLAGCRAKRAF